MNALQLVSRLGWKLVPQEQWKCPNVDRVGGLSSAPSVCTVSTTNSMESVTELDELNELLAEKAVIVH